MPTDDELIIQIRRDFGYMASFLDIPELRGILLQAARESWDQARLQGAVQKTTWWKKTSETEREWAALQSDPAEVTRRVTQRAADLKQQAVRLGIRVTTARLNKIATDSLRFGWDQVQLQNALGAEYDFKPGKAQKQTGVAVVSLDQLRTEARQWAVPMSDKGIEPWIEGIVRGKRTMEEYQTFLKVQAKSMRPWLSDAIDQGFSVAQISDSYRQVASQELGITPDQIDLSNPKWSRFLDHVDPESGKRRQMDLWEWTKTVRTDSAYGWAQGPEGQRVKADLATSLAKTFGRT